MKLKQLEYFLDKICTIFTVPTNRDFKAENPSTFPQPVFHYFIGKVVEIDEKGILFQQWNTNKALKSYFFIDHIIGIAEEEILNPTSPKDAEIIDEYKKTTEKAGEQLKESYEKLKNEENQEIDIEALSQISEKIKNDS
jgi:hypothetical protein